MYVPALSMACPSVRPHWQQLSCTVILVLKAHKVWMFPRVYSRYAALYTYHSYSSSIIFARIVPWIRYAVSLKTTVLSPHPRARCSRARRSAPALLHFFAPIQNEEDPTVILEQTWHCA
eukprot:COSAG02_NODE_4227_length_5610_cov_4.036654_1_plen_119_part_00